MMKEETKSVFFKKINEKSTRRVDRMKKINYALTTSQHLK